jgi:hypothetical protein
MLCIVLAGYKKTPANAGVFSLFNNYPLMSSHYYLSLLSNLFYNQQKIYLVKPEKTHGHIRDDSDNFAFQVIKELLKDSLVGGHPNIEPVYFVFHLIPPLQIRLPYTFQATGLSQ